MASDWRAERDRAIAERARLEEEKNIEIREKVKNYFQEQHGLTVSTGSHPFISASSASTIISFVLSTS